MTGDKFVKIPLSLRHDDGAEGKFEGAALGRGSGRNPLPILCTYHLSPGRYRLPLEQGCNALFNNCMCVILTDTSHEGLSSHSRPEETII